MRKAYFRPASRILPCLLMLSLIPAWCETSAAQERARKEPPTPGPMLAQGRITLDTPEFTLDLVRSSQTVAGLKPKAAPAFDFTPGDLIVERSKDGYYHLGDLNLRVRIGSSDEWKNYSTAVVRQPVIALPAAGAVLAAADLSPTLPADIPLQISRIWALVSMGAILGGTMRSPFTGVIFVLELTHEGCLRLAAHRSPDLVQALADLLLEALGGGTDEETQAVGGRDESEDHA